jgi:hypothetical protein
MKIKLDENLPTSLVADLTALGHDVDTAPTEGLAGHPDSDVWRAAQSAGRFLITQDLDFSDVRAFAPGTHHGILPRSTLHREVRGHGIRRRRRVGARDDDDRRILRTHTKRCLTVGWPTETVSRRIETLKL